MMNYDRISGGWGKGEVGKGEKTGNTRRRREDDERNVDKSREKRRREE